MRTCASALFILASTLVAGCDPTMFPNQIPDLPGLKPGSLPELTECLGLSQAQCSANPNCAVAFGQALDLEGSCKAPTQIAGCTSMDCGDGALALARDWFGTKWLFPTGCYPDGWVAVDSPSAGQASSWPECPEQSDDEPGPSCEALDDQTCQATQGCQLISGIRLDLDSKCRISEKSAGCTSMDCGDGALMFAKDRKGSTWLFAVACYPDGWTELEPDAKDPARDAFSWSECSANAGS